MMQQRAQRRIVNTAAIEAVLRFYRGTDCPDCKRDRQSALNFINDAGEDGLEVYWWTDTKGDLILRGFDPSAKPDTNGDHYALAIPER